MSRLTYERLAKASQSKASLPVIGSCLLYQGQPNSRKPIIRFEKKFYAVQRLAWRLLNSVEPPEFYQVTSKCGFIRCIQEAHLYLKPKASSLKAVTDDSSGSIADSVDSIEPNALTVQEGAFRLPVAAEETITMVLANQTSPVTRKAYESSLRSFFRWMIKHRLPRFDKDSVLAYRDDIKTQYSGSTVNARINVLRVMARELRDRRLLDVVDVQAIENIKPVPAKRRKVRWLVIEDLKRLIDVRVSDREARNVKAKAVLYLFVLTGLRVAEVARLTWDQIKQDHATGRWIIEDVDLKGRVRTNTIGLPAIASQALMDFKSLGSDTFEPSGSVFDLGQQGLRELVNKAASLIGLQASPHDLRRSFARIAYQRGVDLEQLRKALGHKDIKTTLLYVGDVFDFSKVPGDEIEKYMKGLL